MNKKSHKIPAVFAALILGVTAIACLLAAILIPAMTRKSIETQEAALPESAISAYLQSLQNQDIEELYQTSLLVSPHYKAKFNLRPRQLILGVTPNERTLRRMSIYWGVVPIKSREFNTTDDICDGAIELAKVKQYVETGDVVVLTAGIPSPNVKQERSAASNMMRIATVD